MSFGLIIVNNENSVEQIRETLVESIQDLTKKCTCYIIYKDTDTKRLLKYIHLNESLRNLIYDTTDEKMFLINACKNFKTIVSIENDKLVYL